MATTAWIFSYKLRKNVSEEQFIERTKKLHDEVISKAKGFISWEHYLQGKAVTEEFYACIQMNTCRALISQLVKKY